MGDIAKGVLGGGWALVVGWLLPAALNLAVFFFGVAPSLQRTAVIERVWPGSASQTALLLLCAAVLFGIVLNALQTPLYRILEGYLLWPRGAYDRGCRRQQARKERIADLIAHPEDRTPVQRALLNEQLARYPADDGQLAPTRLGNAIRRFEEYGHNRFLLDTQVLWNELNATAPAQARRQVETARTSVDFFVALLYGHGAVAVLAMAALTSADAERPLLVVIAITLSALIPLWYRSAVYATDEWAAAVRAMVNLGRKPLADSLGLVLPQQLAEERTMWRLVTRMSRRPYRDAADTAFAPYRAAPPDPHCPIHPPAPGPGT
ncbi:putative membrane protein [Streptomyces davaonensis JCM 4913]|uniref:Putative membrane protein n=1 Tax=Streptomyces davaonensis (strain DSM 101723 / JCM 4913 / KCC S-0913 / 768) TaxID=1214101 RepID=K4QSH0_STRDJ|nr:hypothetical protein [Streptomyces davaonensis]CCK24636.1 putative membrane protein [Streptomyces davaonensis JCM 4913]